jgi:hypothetical protein
MGATRHPRAQNRQNRREIVDAFWRLFTRFQAPINVTGQLKGSSKLDRFGTVVETSCDDETPQN